MKILILNDYDCGYSLSVTTVINGRVNDYNIYKPKKANPNFVQKGYKYMFDFDYREKNTIEKLFKNFDIVLYFVDGQRKESWSKE